MSGSLRPLDRSRPGFSAHGVSQARILEWVARSFSSLCLYLSSNTWGFVPDLVSNSEPPRWYRDPSRCRDPAPSWNARPAHLPGGPAPPCRGGSILFWHEPRPLLAAELLAQFPCLASSLWPPQCTVGVCPQEGAEISPVPWPWPFADLPAVTQRTPRWGDLCLT